MKLFFLFITTLFCFDIHAKADQETKFLLITGCGRSGTTFITNFLTASGLDIKHEGIGLDGCVGWQMCGLTPPIINFEHVFHQVRHPLDVISSWYTNGFQHPVDSQISKYSKKKVQHAVWDFIQQHVPEIRLEDDFLTQCAKYWYYWNLKAEQISEWRYRIEDLENILSELEARLNIPLKSEILHSLSKSTNTWLKIEHRLTWSELEAALPQDLYLNIQDMALRYGYSIMD